MVHVIEDHVDATFILIVLVPCNDKDTDPALSLLD